MHIFSITYFCALWTRKSLVGVLAKAGLFFKNTHSISKMVINEKSDKGIRNKNLNDFFLNIYYPNFTLKTSLLITIAVWFMILSSVLSKMLENNLRHF